MGKRKKFEELLSAEMRWPTLGDIPFSPAEDPSDNANISKDDFTRMVLMTDGYKQAADLMVDHTVENKVSRDFLVFPVIFNYRHFLELSLKYLIATNGPSVKIEPIWDTHDLAILWAAFTELLNRYGTNDPDDAEIVVEEIVAEFAKIDPGSYSHRYPYDRNAKPLPIAYVDIDLMKLADVIKGVASYFTGCDGYLSDLRNAQA